VRGRLRKGGGDRFEDTCHLTQHIVVPKSQDAIDVIDKPFVANRVAPVVCVLATINFNDETKFAANEVNRIGTDRLLPNELEAIEPSRPKSIPQCGFRVSDSIAQASGAPGFDLIGFAHGETPPTRIIARR
jgi:hypothetical protein